jgi:hypothetical protein
VGRTEQRESAPPLYSPLRRLVANHPMVAFLVIAFGFGWISLIPILLAENGFGVRSIELPLTVVQTLATVLGLALLAFLVTAATGGTCPHVSSPAGSWTITHRSRRCPPLHSNTFS